ncbi:hypothetical protein [Streptomyces sp. NPDC058861]|uniref:hypothetical protein n=1 Tax=Streptomyces sp. NPDC058861 TaxID=3346653 RepID=UPI003695B1D5
MDDPARGAERMRVSAQALRPWVTWSPDFHDLSLTGERVSAAVVLWDRGAELRGTCVSELERIASVLMGPKRGETAMVRDSLVRVLRDVAEVVDSISALVRTLLASHEEFLPPVSDMSFEQEAASKRLVAILADLNSCAAFLGRTCLSPALGVRLTGGVLVGGGWGTGKSYGVAAWVEERIGAGRPTALVCGYQFQGNRGFEEQLVENCGGLRPGSARELLALLQSYARERGESAVLVVDALNEVSAVKGDPGEAFAALVELANEFPDVMLVATLRMDAPPPREKNVTGAMRKRRYAFQWNAGVRDPVAAWRVFQDMYGLPPLVPPPDVRDLKRPLLLAVLAYSVHHSPEADDGPVTVPSVGGLFRKWLGSLEADWARYCGHDAVRNAPPVIERACELIAGSLDVKETVEFGTVLSVLGGHGFTDPERILNWLHGVGVIGTDAANGHVRFAVQRFAEHVRARNLLCGPRPARAVAGIVEDLKGEEQAATAAGRMVEALAGALPHVRPGSELSCLLPRRRPLRADLIVLESFEGREPVSGGEGDAKAIAFLRRTLRRPDAASWVWYAVFVNCTYAGHPMGMGFLDATLAGLENPGDFHRRFTLPVLNLMDNPDGLDLLRRVLAWVAERNSQADPVLDTTTLLMWLSSVPYVGLRDTCTRIASDLWADFPEVALTQVERFGAHDDALIAETAWRAAHGALLRRGDLPPAESWLAVVERDVTRAHLRIHDAVAGVRALWMPGDRSSFPLRPMKLPRAAAVVPNPNRRIRRIERALGSWCPVPEDSPLPRLTWLSRRTRRLEAVRPKAGWRQKNAEPTWPEATAEGKAPLIAAQEWYAVESWKEAGTLPPPRPGENGAARYHQRATDPTLSPAWPTTLNTTVRTSAWWAVPPEGRESAGAHGILDAPVSEIVTVSAPEGHGWWVLHGAFHSRRAEDPEYLYVYEEAGEDVEGLPVLRRPPAVIRSEDRWRLASPARRRFQRASFLEIDTLCVRVGTEERAARALRANRLGAAFRESWPGQAYLAEYYRHPEHAHPDAGDTPYRPTAIEHPGAWSPLSRGGNTLPSRRKVPGRQLVRQLGLRWTGHHLDFTDPEDGAVLLRDPSLTEGGPDCLLLAPSAAPRITAGGWTLLWHIRHMDPFLTERHRFAVLRPGGIVEL